MNLPPDKTLHLLIDLFVVIIAVAILIWFISKSQ